MSRTTTQRVSANLRAEVARQRIPQADMAKALALSQPAVSRRLQGRTPLTVDELVRCASLLGVMPADLLADGATKKRAA